MKHDHEKDGNALDCKEVVKKIFEYLDGELDEHTHADIEHHMDHCRSCFSRAEFEAELKNKVKNNAEEKAPDELKNRIDKLIGNF
ncbi:MAG: mycothiol system anti-sigma-R factor [Rhodospirillaceae bacterium]|nr:mycothiol system anti-sigma-R factor [Rhodospirillaceae bacterium]